MKIIQHHFYTGPNVWAPYSGLMLTLSLDDADNRLLAWRPSASQLSRLVNLITAAFPTAVESALLSNPEKILQAKSPWRFLQLAIVEVLVRDFCLTPRMGRPIKVERNQQQLFLPCDDLQVGLAAARLVFLTTSSAIDLPDTQRTSWVTQARQYYLQARQSMRQFGLNQSTLALARAARERDIPYYRFAEAGRFLQLGQGHKRLRTMETITDHTSAVGSMICADKLATGDLLQSHRLPTPNSQAIASLDEALQAANKLGYPLVIKPRSLGKGIGVVTGIRDEQSLKQAYASVAKLGQGMIIEQFVQGYDHRLLVVGGKLVAAARRLPPIITGDGQRSVRQLVDELNRDPRRGMKFERLMEQVKLDDEAASLLAVSGLTFDSILPKGKAIALRRTANISTGGSALDLTEQVHPDNRALAEHAAQLVGLDVTGLDFLTPDISRSWREIPSAILEVNASPGLRPHQIANPQQDVAGPIVDSMFHQSSNGRIPTAGITGSVGKTTTCRMLAWILSRAFNNVALATTQGGWIGTEKLISSDVAGGITASRMLQDLRVEAGVFELARGGLIKTGMVLDALDVGCVLNVQDNHLGIDGLNTREELARVKRLVVENSRELAVLNADDPLCLGMLDKLSAKRICLVSENPDNPALADCLANGGLVATLAGSQLRLWDANQRVGEMSLTDIPASWQGQFRPAMIAAMNATALAYGLGMRFADISAALKSFVADAQTNPGRMEQLIDTPFSVVLDYTDGEYGMAELVKVSNSFQDAGKKRLMLTAAGDRSNAFIQAMTRAAAADFDEFICYDYADLRDRQPGEVAGLIKQELIEAGVDAGKIFQINQHEDAVKHSVNRCQTGDLLMIVTYTDAQTRKLVEQLVK